MKYTANGVAERNKKHLNIVHCKTCDYSGNKGKFFIKSDEQGKSTRIVTYSGNYKWCISKILLPNDSISWGIKCPICGGRELIYE